MAGLEIIGAISAVSGLLESAIGLFERVRKTYNDEKKSTEVLGNYVFEIQRILAILELVENEADLRTAAVLSEIENIRKIAEKLVGSLERMMPGEKGQIRRFAHQFAHGSREQEALVDLMDRLNRAKSNLALNLHVAHVGITRVVGDNFTINIDILNRIDKLLRNVFGEDGGLKIANLVKDRPLEDDGFVHVNSGEFIPSMDDDNLKESHPKDANSIASRIVLRNVTKEQAFQINGPIGERGWREVNQLEICDNEASGSSLQINHAVSEELFLQLLAQQRSNQNNSLT
ncbi:hypothetical protein DID88_001652 [Monilinia fructigena]|uniref:NACHT-NTPase and P-loop NTPases N-terminal domain-containing protein n=1 Tax=Monilinia fructigena TaxID=38457 RepID=A0A395J1U3_9HELO|nr:hypothetical protein DID88_001652 [Monilinia fructigena]